jgi:hypothetical protein
VLTGVHDREHDSEDEQGLRDEEPAWESVLADDQEGDDRPGRMERRQRCHDVVAPGFILARREVGEADVVEPLLGAVGASTNVISPRSETIRIP